MTYYKCGSVYTTQNSNTVIDTASGSIANFETPLAMPLLDAQIDVNAVQDLHGQSGAYPPGGGVNKFDKDTMVVSGYYIADTNGQAKPDSGSSCTDYIEINPDTSYYIKTEQTVGQWAAWYDENKDYISGFAGYNRVVTSPSTAKYIRLTVVRQGSGNPNTFSVNYPSTDTAYHPYSNICPIDGWDEIKVGYVDFNQLTKRASTTSHGITTSIDDDGTMTLSGVCDTVYANITEPIYSIAVGRVYLIGRTVISNPNNVSFRWSFLNSNTTPLSPSGVETAWKICKVDTTNGASTGISGFASNTDLTGIKVKVVCIDLTQALGKEKANYLHGLGDAGVAIVRQLFTKDYYPYNAGGTLVSLNDVNGKPVCPVDIIQLNNTYYGGRFIQDKSGKRKFEVTHEKAAYNLADQYYTNENGFDGWIIYRATRAEQTPNSPIGKLCNCCPEYKYADSTLGRPHYYISAGAFVIYLPENTYRNGYLEYTFPLETPYTIDLPDGTPFKSLPGVNNFFADTGDTTVEFRKIG